MNVVFLLGRLTKDPEVRYTPSGKVVASFVLAVDRPFVNPQGEREADFINCNMWGKQAEVIGNTVSKGQRLMVEGRLQIRSFDGKDGQKHWFTEVLVANFEYVERKSASAPASSNSQTQQHNQPYQAGPTVPDDTEIPF